VRVAVAVAVRPMSAYDDLLDRYRRVSNLSNAAMLLGWDQ
jgi:Zn-dependent M32 family carboxypeptidase